MAMRWPPLHLGLVFILVFVSSLSSLVLSLFGLVLVLALVFVPVFSWFGVGLVSVFSGEVSVWSCFGLGLPLRWSWSVWCLSWFGLGVVSIFSWSGLGLVLVWSWFGRRLALGWSWSGIGNPASN